MDCMKEMIRYSDNYFDVAIVDPPYYSGPEKEVIMEGGLAL